MPSVQNKNVPDDVHRTLQRRAAGAGQSMQEYLLMRLTLEARSESLDEVLARAGQRAGGRLGFAESVDAIRSERDGR